MTRRSRASANQSALPEGLNDGVRYIQEFMERFKNRLTFKNLALSKRYISGQLTLHLHYRPARSLDGDLPRERCAVFQEQMDNRVMSIEWSKVKLDAAMTLMGDVRRELQDYPIVGSDRQHGGGVRLCANKLIPQGRVLAPAGVRPAA